MNTHAAEPVIEVLISTCNNGLFNAVAVPDLPQDGVQYLICHQVFDTADTSGFNETLSSISARDDIRYVRTASRGLAVNRNTCLHHATGDILLFADDDIELAENWADTVRTSFAEYPQAAALTFMVKTPEGAPFKRYSEHNFRHNWKTLMRVSSVEVAIRRDAVQRTGLRFDERFGLGADYVASEENIFLTDALGKGLILMFVPKYLLIHPPESSGQRLTEPRLIASKGAFFKRVFGWKGAFLLAAFCLKKWPEYRAAMSPIRFMRLALSTFNKV